MGVVGLAPIRDTEAHSARIHTAGRDGRPGRPDRVRCRDVDAAYQAAPGGDLHGNVFGISDQVERATRRVVDDALRIVEPVLCHVTAADLVVARQRKPDAGGDNLDPLVRARKRFTGWRAAGP